MRLCYIQVRPASGMSPRPDVGSEGRAQDGQNILPMFDGEVFLPVHRLSMIGSIRVWAKLAAFEKASGLHQVSSPSTTSGCI